MSKREEVGRFLSWDSEFFGFRIGRATGSRLTDESVSELLSWAGAERLRCLYLSADSEDPTTLRLAAQAGFQFVDVRLDLSLASSRGQSAPRPPDASLRQAHAGDLIPLQAIARDAHRDTRFFKDANFGEQQARKLYARWIERDLVTHTVFLTTDPSEPTKPVGYISCQPDEQGAGRIGLTAIAVGHQGRGLGRQLMSAALDWFAAQNITTINVATQASNIRAQRFYQSAGFRSAHASVWFHRWF